MTFVWLALFLYLWPLKIAPTEEQNLRFWYPITADYWCPAKPVQAQGELNDPLLQN
jgi:hypothetical protein